MLWVLYSLISAFSIATADTISKRALEKADEYAIAWSRFAFAAPYLILALLFIEIPKIDTTFWVSILILIPLEIAATILYIKAIKASPLSLTIPFLSFTPLFLIITAFVMLGETPSPAGVIGIILIVLGAYSLNLNTFKKGMIGLLGPFKAIMKESGSIYMIMVAFIFGITSSLGKLAILHSSPVFFGVIYYLLLAVAFTPLVFIKAPGKLKLRANLLVYNSIGFFIALMLIFHVLAIVLTDVSYMIAVKRTSILFSVIYGRLIFKEAGFRKRILGSALMILGVAVISILG